MASFEEPAGTNMSFCASLVDEWIRCGLTHAVVSPGSRSTPMALAIAARSEIELTVRLDERSAGFFALGIARATRRPVAVVVTSGTAVAELVPAASEAFYGRVPLIMVTSDRPPRLHGVGAPQTMAQADLFKPAIRAVIEPGPPTNEGRTYWRSIACQAFARASGSTPGPVQLNLAFDEPLLDGASHPSQAREGNRPWYLESTSLGVAPIEELERIFSPLRRGVILLGASLDDATSIYSIAESLQWPILADPLSGVISLNQYVVRHSDSILRSDAAKDVLRPDVIIKVGDPHSSKVTGAYVTECAFDYGVEVIGMNGGGVLNDPDRLLSRGYVCDLDLTFRALSSRLADRRPAKRLSDYMALWRDLDGVASQVIGEVLDMDDALSEPGTARALAGLLDPSDVIVVSSSMPIRDLEWYAAKTDSFPRVIANRGVNGIDGVVSTFLGAASASSAGSLTVGLLGDLALLHDFGALLWRLSELPRGLLMVNDNDGGAIFSFLAQRTELDEKVFERLFGTPHGLDLISLLRGVGLDARRVTTPRELADLVQFARRSDTFLVAVSTTERVENQRLHAELGQRCADSIDSRLNRYATS